LFKLILPKLPACPINCSALLAKERAFLDPESPSQQKPLNSSQDSPSRGAPYGRGSSRESHESRYAEVRRILGGLPEMSYELRRKKPLGEDLHRRLFIECSHAPSV
jgi:hypothetical protein